MAEVWKRSGGGLEEVWWRFCNDFYRPVWSGLVWSSSEEVWRRSGGGLDEVRFLRRSGGGLVEVRRRPQLRPEP